jgi:hypothetical protein
MFVLYEKFELNCMISYIPFHYYLFKNVVKTIDIVSLKDSRRHLHNIQNIVKHYKTSF